MLNPAITITLPEWLELGAETYFCGPCDSLVTGYDTAEDARADALKHLEGDHHGWLGRHYPDAVYWAEPTLESVIFDGLGVMGRGVRCVGLRAENVGGEIEFQVFAEGEGGGRSAPLSGGLLRSFLGLFPEV